MSSGVADDEADGCRVDGARVGEWSAEDKIWTMVHDRHAVVTVCGELDMRNAPELWSQVHRAFAAKDLGAVVIDLTSALFLESMTIAVLLELSKDAARRQLELGIVVGDNNVARRVLALAGVDQLLALFHCEEDAVGALLRR